MRNPKKRLIWISKGTRKKRSQLTVWSLINGLSKCHSPRNLRNQINLIWIKIKVNPVNLIKKNMMKKTSRSKKRRRMVIADSKLAEVRNLAWRWMLEKPKTFFLNYKVMTKAEMSKISSRPSKPMMAKRTWNRSMKLLSKKSMKLTNEFKEAIKVRGPSKILKLWSRGKTVRRTITTLLRTFKTRYKTNQFLLINELIYKKLQPLKKIILLSHLKTPHLNQHKQKRSLFINPRYPNFSPRNQ